MDRKLLNRSLDPENALLLGLLRASLGTGSMEICMAALEDCAVDWKRLEGLLLEHRALSLVYDELSILADGGLIPAAQWQRLGSLNRSLQLRQLNKTRELLEIAKAFDVESIRYLTLKGPALSQYLFGDAAKRHCNDLDLLVLKGDFDRAAVILMGLGYSRESETFDARVDRGESAESLSHHLHFARSGSEVELHWRLSSIDHLYTDSLQVLYRRRSSVTIGAQSLPILAPGDMLDYLTLHGTAHCWHRLKWLYDVCRASQLGDSCSNQPSLIRAVQWRAALSDAVFQDRANEKFKSHMLSRILTRLSISQIVGARLGPDSAKAVLERSLAVFLCSIGMRSKIRYMYRLFNWRGISGKFPMPRRLSFLYCVIGPFYWLWRRCLR